jgi:hypothetical protein
MAGFVDMIFGINTAGTQIAALRLDALVDETLEFPSIVTEYPVENNSPMSDGILPGAPRLSIRGVVSSSSASIFGGLLDGGIPFGKTKLLDAIEAIKRVHSEHIPVTIVTGLGVYTDMGMSACRLGRHNSEMGGKALTIDCEFSVIRKVSLQTTDVPADANSSASGKTGATKAAAGNAASSEPPAPVQAKSSSILKSLGTKLGF